MILFLFGYFPKSERRIWKKSTAIEEHSCHGGARQSRRLKERKHTPKKNMMTYQR
jgi:hypothetical protein